MTADAPERSIPRVDMATIQGRISTAWVPGISPVQLIVAENGAGKTGLITRVIMPHCAYDRVLTIDVKGDDPMMAGYGKPIERVTPALWTADDGEGPGGRWFRLVVDPVNDRANARERVAEALDLALSLGHAVLVADETRTITDREELNLRDKLEAALLRGRSRYLSAVLAAQATDYMVGAVRNQWAMAWLGSLKDDEVIKRALKIVGLPYSERGGYLPIVRDIPRRSWLYLDRESGRPMLGMAET